MDKSEICEFDLKMLDKAFEVAKTSHAKKRKVGAIIVDMTLGMPLIISEGKNKMFEDLNNTFCENDSGDSFECVIHAEEDAIMKMMTEKYEETKNTEKTIYVTYSPCMNCCKLIAFSGIKRLVYRDEHPINFKNSEISNGYSPKLFLEALGVEVVRYPKNKTALIYHSADNDGLMSGYLLSIEYEKELKDGSADLIPYNYGENDEWMSSYQYNKYVFVDITPKIWWLKKHVEDIEILNISIQIYDHHEDKYNQIFEEFENLINNNKVLFEYYFHPSISGCAIFANYAKLEMGNELSLMSDLTSLYDTWRFADEDFKPYESYYNIFIDKNTILEFATYIQQYKNLELFTKVIKDLLLTNFRLNFNNALKTGSILLAKVFGDNESVIKNGKYIEDFDCLFYPGYPNYFLEGQTREQYNNLKYMIGFQIDLKKELFKFSIRSKNEKNCHTIAKQWGGGGHPKASGFVVCFEIGMSLISNPSKIFTDCIPSEFLKV